MVAFKLLSPDVFDTPHGYCCKEVEYVCRLDVLIRVYTSGKLGDVDLSPFHNLALLKCDVLLVARRKIFDCDNNLCLQRSAKGSAYVARP